MPEAPAAAGPRRRAIAAAMGAAIVLELGARGLGVALFQHGAWLAMGALAILAIPRLGLREAYLLTLCAVLSAAVLWRVEAPGAVLAAALDQASFLMVFILLLSLLYEAAATSPAVADLGRYLTRQPPGRRYYALYSGTAALAVLFNVGTVSFLVPLIQKGITGDRPGDPLNPIRERRQLSALLRGFAWCVIWSPTAMAPLALMELIEGIDRQWWMLAGFVLFLAIMVVGAGEDWLRHRAYRGAGGARIAAPFPGRAAGRFLLACLWLLGLASIFARLTQDTLVFGLLCACVPMVLGWLIVQARGGGAAPRARVAGIALEALPASAPIAVTLACSGYIGLAAAGLIPAEALAEALGLAAMPDWLLLTAIPVAIAVLSLLALSPIMMAVFFGALFGALPVPPADPTLLALAISCGWALSMTFSPFATVVLIIARVGDVRPARLTFGWNLGFTLAAIPVLAATFALLTGVR